MPAAALADARNTVARQRAADLLADVLTRAAKQKAADLVPTERPDAVVASIQLEDLMPELVDALCQRPDLLNDLGAGDRSLDAQLIGTRARFRELARDDLAASPEEAGYANFVACVLGGWIYHRGGQPPS